MNGLTPLTLAQANRAMAALQPSEFIVECPLCSGLILVNWEAAPDGMGWLTNCPFAACKANVWLRLERSSVGFVTSITLI